MNPSISSSCSLEITIKSAEELTIGNQKPVTKNVFVTISVENQGYTNQLRTRPCVEGAKPTWNEKLFTDMSKNAKFILLEVRYKKRSTEKSIGIAKVPTSDFVGNHMPLNYQHCLCYRLRDRNGEPNGIISFSVNVKGELDNYQCNQTNQNYREAIEIQGFGNRENCYRPKPRLGTSLLGDRRKSTATVVGVPAAWYDSCHA
ncbi:BON1-associated protein 1-like [Spinacia oleracea]|uniref:BON1-associated protein 1-like n=1 Tax=Spinacia oleracea TaxID=3562 RepID=A0ABM3RD64_SPIOL|nr:BON1-associated protein 1-like [Spinacia oleracea]XP_056693547.1 BON1-associated protein 1-like [Spinacia oleracea]